MEEAENVVEKLAQGYCEIERRKGMKTHEEKVIMKFAQWVDKFIKNE